MSEKSKSGKQAIVFDAVKGSLIEGDGLTPLADNSWFLINSVASSGSQLPFGVGYVFKSPDSGNAITPIADDDVYPLTFTKICKVDATVTTAKGDIDVTDDCANGYNEYITDGFTDITGTITSFLKFNDPGGGLTTTQKSYLQRFFDINTDDGAGTYVLGSKNDNDIYLAILMNQDQVAVDDVQVWLFCPAILTGTGLDKPLKGPQNMDIEWKKAEGPASIYERTTNSEETVF